MKATILTNKGTINLELYKDKTPLTVSNFANLSNKGYYDNLTFHRVIDDFMIQGGCPNGTGAGGPGYEFKDEFHPDLKHDKPGILSMANSGPGTNGSQFFITEVPYPSLDGIYVVFGQLVKGIEIQDSISNVKTGPGNRPITDVVINELNIIRKGEAAQLFDAPKTWNNKNEIEKELRLKEEIKMKEEIRKLDSLTKIDLIKLEDYNKKSKKTKSGIKIHIIKRGKGIKPKDGNVVKLYADGYLTNGLLFWSNNKKINERHGKYDVEKESTGFYDPISMELSPNMQLIPGFKEAIYTMNVGDIIYCYIPSNLAYGDESKGLIKPNSDLSFIIQMANAEN